VGGWIGEQDAFGAEISHLPIGKLQNPIDLLHITPTRASEERTRQALQPAEKPLLHKKGSEKAHDIEEEHGNHEPGGRGN